MIADADYISKYVTDDVVAFDGGGSEHA